MPYDTNATKKKKKETLAEKARTKLSSYFLPKKKESEAFEGNLGVATSKINKRRRLLRESLKY